MKAALDVFRDKLVKRKVSLKHLETGEPAGVRQGIQDRGHLVTRHQPRECEEDLEDDSRRGTEGREGPDPRRRTARHQQESRRPPGDSALLDGKDLDVALQYVNYR